MKTLLLLLTLLPSIALSFTPPSAISNLSASAMTFSVAAKYCYDLNEAAQTDWRLPEVEELAYFVGTVAGTNHLWTTSYNFSGAYFTIKPSNGSLGSLAPDTSYPYVRCVR